LLVNEGGQLGFAHGAHFGGSQLATFEHHQGGDATDAQLAGDVAVFVHVHLGDLQLAFVGGGYFVQDGGNHFARTAPFGPIVHQHGFVSLQNVCFEAGIGDVFDQIAGHGLFPLSIGDRATVGALWQKPSTPMKTLTIDVVSDVVCPWCYVGKRRLERALALLAVQHPDVDPEVRWHTFQLNPDMAPEGMARADYVRNKFGDEGSAIYERVAGVGKEVGIPFAFDRIVRQPNTVVAHSLIAVSEPGMVQDAMVEAFFKAYFLDGLDLTQASVLLDIAESAGMDRAVAEQHLQNSALHSQTLDSDKAAREMGITGVPFFIFNRQVGLSGAHEAETLLQGMVEAMNAATDD